MITGGIKVIGNSKAIEALSTKGALIGDIGTGIYIIAEMIMTDSKANYVPVGLPPTGTGNLKQSGTVLEPEFQTSSVSVRLGYGMDYARIVHDRPPTIGQGKVRYLEIPFLAAIPGAEKRLNQIVSQAIQTVLKTKQPTSKDGWKAHQSQGAQKKRVDSGSSG